MEKVTTIAPQKHFYSSIIIIVVKFASTHVCNTKYFAFSTFSQLNF